MSFDDLKSTHNGLTVFRSRKGSFVSQRRKDPIDELPGAPHLGPNLLYRKSSESRFTP